MRTGPRGRCRIGEPGLAGGNPHHAPPTAVFCRSPPPSQRRPGSHIYNGVLARKISSHPPSFHLRLSRPRYPFLHRFASGPYLAPPSLLHAHQGSASTSRLFVSLCSLGPFRPSSDSASFPVLPSPFPQCFVLFVIVWGRPVVHSIPPLPSLSSALDSIPPSLPSLRRSTNPGFG